MRIPSNRIKDIAVYFRNELVDQYETGEIDQFLNWCLEAFAGYTRNDLLLRPDSRVTESELLKLYFAVKDLKHGRPIQYITGKSYFLGLTLQVSSAVLIPRPETEELVEWVLDEYGNRPDSFSIVDIGTGSGCIAIALKQKLSRCHVYAVDVSVEALDIAKINAENSSTDIHFIQTDVLVEGAVSAIPNCLVMISNPPYIRRSEENAMHKNVLEHEPHTALFVPDDDALIFYQAIGKLALEKLKAGGCLYVEINEALGLETCILFQKLGFTDVRLRQDMQGKDRMVAAKK